MNYSEAVQTLVRVGGYQSYLELGVAWGSTFIPMTKIARRCIGVDIQDLRTEKVGEFYKQSTEEFFKWWKEPVEAIFIDADHKYESVLYDLEHAVEILAPDGIILLHDTDPRQIHLLGYDHCQDAYKIVDVLWKQPNFDSVTIQTESCGLTIVRRKADRNIYKVLSDIDRIATGTNKLIEDWNNGTIRGGQDPEVPRQD